MGSESTDNSFHFQLSPTPLISRVVYMKYMLRTKGNRFVPMGALHLKLVQLSVADAKHHGRYEIALNTSVNNNQLDDAPPYDLWRVFVFVEMLFVKSVFADIPA